jgi:F0F1-type ATP synthase delta subunit
MKIDPYIKNKLKKIFSETLKQSKEVITFTSSGELSSDQIELLLKSIVTKRGKPEVVFETDPELLAGVVIKKGSRTIDLSIKGRLEQLQNNLYGSI